MVSTPKNSSTPKSTPPLRPTKTNPQGAGARHRSLSAPVLQPPFISIEDVTQPLTLSEDSLHKSPSRQDSRDSSGSGSSEGQPNQNGHRRSSAYHHRKRSPNVGWKKKWDEEHRAFREGRLLIVDCYSRDHSDDGKRKTAAYEFERISELEEFYASGPGRREGHALRIIHVQNAVWARDFLLKKFNISSKVEDVVGTAFGRWVKYDKPQLRVGKPVLNAKSFRIVRDPWRGVSRTGFGTDYLKSYRPGVIADDSEVAKRGFKMMDLNHWDENTGTVPVHGYECYVQRLSVYVQRKEGQIDLHPSLDTEVRNPYIALAGIRWEHDENKKADEHAEIVEEDGIQHEPRKGSVPLSKGWEGKVYESLASLDNGNTIIVFEASHTGRPDDTLIQAREEIEVRWRRLMFYLQREDIPEEPLALECMDLVLKDIFKGLQMSWEKLLSKCEAHVNILEDKVYENPADESRAPELWSNSALWLQVEKLISLHKATVNDLQQQMSELSESEEFTKDDWLKNAPQDLQRVGNLFDEEMVKPTANLSDLLYKSVGIRDSRHSLQLGTSMWRLSWITFIFLPLTFISGFFGMNVDLFQPGGGYPSLKWYFVAAVPLMILIVVLYIIIKSTLVTSHDIPMQRGVYEQIYIQFASDHPQLWSRNGPKSYIRPRGLLGRLKWRIVKMWFDPARTIAKRTITEIDEMGIWARIKRHVAQRWLAQIEPVPGSGDEELGLPDGEFSTVTELLRLSAPVGMADAYPGIAEDATTPPFQRVFGRSRSSRSSSRSRLGANRPTSSGSDMVIEEEKSDGGSTMGIRGKEKEKGRSQAKRTEKEESPASDGANDDEASRIRSEPVRFTSGLLNVPLSLKRGEEHAP